MVLSILLPSRDDFFAETPTLQEGMDKTRHGFNLRGVQMCVSPLLGGGRCAAVEVGQ